MSGFAGSWLALREPADRAARDARLLGKAAGYGEGRLIVDIGCGTGSTFRALSPLAPGARWLLVDHDEALLRIARSSLPASVELRLADLVQVDEAPLGDAGLVTASALLDLVSEEWLVRLIDQLLAEDAAFYAALNFDGSIVWSEPHAADAAVVEAFNAHQRSDKGFGPALGGKAAEVLARRLRASGFEVETAASPWTIETSSPLHRAFVDGILLALEEAEADVDGLEDWRAFRLGACGGQCRVGHLDLFAHKAS